MARRVEGRYPESWSDRQVETTETKPWKFVFAPGTLKGEVRNVTNRICAAHVLDFCATAAMNKIIKSILCTREIIAQPLVAVLS